MPCQTPSHGVSLDNLEQMVDHRICTLFVVPFPTISMIPALKYHASHTLYPAAYPKPGNSEKNFVSTGAAAFSLNITVLSLAADAI